MLMQPADFVCPSPIALTPEDFAAASRRLQVSIPRIRAVDEVESRGRAFHPETRRPIILYEPHVFSRETKRAFDRSHPQLSYPTWGAQPYPGAQAQRYGQLFDAMKLNEGAALKACSWGRYQIMGFNHRACGFSSVQDFVRAMVSGERAQLDAFAAFVEASPAMLGALRKGDFAGFARRYNGEGYAQHGYDQRLKVAYAKHLAAAAQA